MVMNRYNIAVEKNFGNENLRKLQIANRLMPYKSVHITTNWTNVFFFFVVDFRNLYKTRLNHKHACEKIGFVSSVQHEIEIWTSIH